MTLCTEKDVWSDEVIYLRFRKSMVKEFGVFAQKITPVWILTYHCVKQTMYNIFHHLVLILNNTQFMAESYNKLMWDVCKSFPWVCIRLYIFLSFLI